MPDSTSPQREHPSTYIVQDRSNQEEMARLEIQDKMLTTAMGGVLPELTDPTKLRRVLDVGCGTGGWLLETAKTYPMIEKLFGADISDKMLAYASAQAESQQLDERVEFLPMDALRVLEFPGGYFDLVNQRLGTSWLRTWEWNKILLEYQRVLRIGGIVRITEMKGIVESNSPALTRLGTIALEAFHHSGRLFIPSGKDIADQLVRLLAQHSFDRIQVASHVLVMRAGTPEGQQFYQDIAIGYRVSSPFFRQWTRVPDDYEEIYQQALKEMQQPDFVATWTLVTVWAVKMNELRLLMRGLQ